MGLGHGEIIQSATAGQAEGAVMADEVGIGSSWSAEAFRSYWNALASRRVGDVVDYQVRTADDTEGVYDTHEIHTSRNGLIYFTQQKHDRVGYIRPDGHVKLFVMPEGSHPHGIRLSQDGRLFVTLEYVDKLAELDPLNGTIIKEFDISFDDPSVEGVVGPHGFAIDKKNRLWYTGKSSDVIGWVDPASGEQRRYVLDTRANFGANFGHGILSNASGPINIEIDDAGNAWFVNLLTSEIGRIDTSNNLKLFPIMDLASEGNTRPINVFQGPDGYIWVTVEGDNNSSLPANSLQNKGGIARFDQSTETFIGYQQYKSKGAGGTVGATKDTVWFQYQEEALVELKIDADGRETQTNYELPSIGQRVMHRIAHGPDGNMWFTSLMQDTVSVLTTVHAGLPVHAFQNQSNKGEYLTALPDEMTLLQQHNSGFGSQEGLFLSSLDPLHSTATHRFKDQLTGGNVWSIDPQQITSNLNNQRYAYEGLDFRVFNNPQASDHLIPVYEAEFQRRGSQRGLRSWAVDPSDFGQGFSDPKIAWYAHPFPVEASQF